MKQYREPHDLQAARRQARTIRAYVERRPKNRAILFSKDLPLAIRIGATQTIGLVVRVTTAGHRQ